MVDKHPMGQAVLHLLDEVREDCGGMGGKLMLVVVEDAEQQPILRIKTVGLGAFMALVGGLQDLGLHDRLEHHSGPELGVDAAFN